MSRVLIARQDRVLEFDSIPGETLLDVLRRSGAAVSAPCGGNGTCGKCRVTLVEPDGSRDIASGSGGQERRTFPCGAGRSFPQSRRQSRPPSPRWSEPESPGGRPPIAPGSTRVCRRREDSSSWYRSFYSGRRRTWPAPHPESADCPHSAPLPRRNPAVGPER